MRLDGGRSWVGWYLSSPSRLTEGTLLRNPLRQAAPLLWQCGHGLTVFSRIRGAVIHARGKIAHHRLSAADVACKHALQFDLVSFDRQLVAHLLRKPVFHPHIAAAKRVLAEPRRLQRCLNVHLEISKVGYELRVCLRLVPTAHDSERHARIAFLSKRGNNGVQRPLSSCQGVGRRRVKRKE